MESRIALAVAGAGGMILFFWALQLLLAPGTAPFAWAVWGLALLLLWLVAVRLRHRVLGPVQSLANIIEAIRLEDYGLRARTVAAA